MSEKANKRSVATMTPHEALDAAVKIAGGQAPLARLIGKRQSHIWNWLNVYKRVPAEACIPIEEATGIPREALRPDIYRPRRKVRGAA